MSRIIFRWFRQHVQTEIANVFHKYPANQPARWINLLLAQLI